MVTKNRYISFRKSVLSWGMSLVVDFVLLGETDSVLVIWGLILYFVFRQRLPRKTVNTFCTASFTSQNKFSYKALAQQSRLSTSNSVLGSKFWLVPQKTPALRQSYTLSRLYASDITHSSIFCSKVTSFPCTHVRLPVHAEVTTAATSNNDRTKTD